MWLGTESGTGGRLETLVWNGAGKNERELPHLCCLILAGLVSGLIPLVRVRKLSPRKFQQPVPGHPSRN